MNDKNITNIPKLFKEQKKLGQIPKDVPKIIVKINHEVLLSAEETL